MCFFPVTSPLSFVICKMGPLSLPHRRPGQDGIRGSNERRVKPRLFVPGFSCKQISTPSPRTCPKEASGNSTEPASLGVKQSAALRGDPPRQNSYSDGGGGEWGPEQRNVEKEAFLTRVPSRPTLVAMVAPLPASLAAGTEPRARTGLGARRAFPWASWFVVEGARSGSRPGRTTRPRRGPGVRRAAAPAQPGHASAGATSREASSRLARRPLGAALGRGGAGPGSPATVTWEPASSPRPRPRHARVPAAPVTREPRAPATPVTQWPWVCPPHNPGARVPAAPAPLPSQT